MKLSLSIVIPTYNGKDLLAKHLPSVIAHCPKDTQIIIVDDASTDTTLDWLAKHYKNQLTVVSLPKNSGFAHAVNVGFKTAKSDLVFLLNNDVSINQHTIERLLPHFNNQQVFAVGCLEELPAGVKRGKSLASFQRGMFIHSRPSKQTSGNTAWVFAASGMFRTSIFHQLSGMDELFKPAYYEDIDLGYRAWKSGYICLFDSTATVKHEAEATMNRTLGHKKTAYVFKNQLLFYWKNVSDLKLILYHFLWLPYHLIFTNFKTKGAFLWGFVLALWQLPSVNNQKTPLPVFTDKQVINLANQ